MVWLQAEHAQTSPLQSPASAETTPSPSAVGIYLRRLAVTPTSFASTITSADDGSHSPTRGGRGATGNGSDGSGASSPKAKPKSGVPAAPDVAGVKKDVELDSLVAYTKESTADWLVNVPSFDAQDGGGGGDGSERSHSDDGRRLRPVPPFQDLAARMPGDAPVGATAAATATRNAPAASGTLLPAKIEAESGATRADDCRGDTSPVCILRPLRARGTLMIRKPGVASAAVVPSVEAEGSDPAGGGDARTDASGSTTGSRGAVEPPPLVAVSLDVEEIALQVDVRQYAVLNAAVSALTMSHRRFKFRTMRPTTSVLDNPEAWWRYAIR